MRISVAKKKNGNDSRYYAINCLPKHSIELRIFRGTLVSETVMGCILFYAAMILFTKNASLKDCNIPQLLPWIHEHQKDYKSAITMLNGRGITV